MRKIYKKIDEVSQTLGLKEKVIFDMKNLENNEILFSLKDGSFKDSDPWFGICENGNSKVVLPLETLDFFLDFCKKLSKENFDLKLERSILQQFPIDFSDVWAVVIEEIKKISDKDVNLQNLDFDKIVADTRIKYPNLFLNFEPQRSIDDRF